MSWLLLTTLLHYIVLFTTSFHLSSCLSHGNTFIFPHTFFIYLYIYLFIYLFIISYIPYSSSYQSVPFHSFDLSMTYSAWSATLAMPVGHFHVALTLSCCQSSWLALITHFPNTHLSLLSCFICRSLIYTSLLADYFFFKLFLSSHDNFLSSWLANDPKHTFDSPLASCPSHCGFLALFPDT